VNMIMMQLEMAAGAEGAPAAASPLQD
jgi:hypothetical protein